MLLGLSESARATTAEEARFRVSYPNSRGRESIVVALDDLSFDVLARLQNRSSSRARVLRFIDTLTASTSLRMLPIDAIVERFDGTRTQLSEELSDVDIVAVVASAGTTSSAAQVIGNACSVRGKTATGLILNSANLDHERVSATLADFRPYTTMLVVSKSDEFVAEMLNALRA